jgi:hypothetical protein
MYKYNQKLIQTRDNSMNNINKSGRDLTGLFKSSSSLSKSLRQRSEQLEETRDQTFKGTLLSSSDKNDLKTSRQGNTLSDSAKLVIAMEKMEKPKNTRELTIRNLSKK